MEGRAHAQRVAAMTLTTTLTWIPVSERLPDSARSVLVVTARGVGEAYFSAKKGWCDPGSAESLYDPPSHWAEMPEGPG